VTYARARPGEISYGTLGPAPRRNIARQLERLTGITMNACPIAAARRSCRTYPGSCAILRLADNFTHPLLEDKQGKVPGVSSAQGPRALLRCRH